MPAPAEPKAPPKPPAKPVELMRPVEAEPPIYRRPPVLVAGAVVLAVLVYLLVAPGSKPPLNPKPEFLSLTYQAGSGLAPQAVVDFGDVRANFSAAAADTWLSVTPASGARVAKLQVIANPEGMAPKGYDSEVRLKTEDGRQRAIPVHLEVLGVTKPVAGGPKGTSTTSVITYEPQQITFEFQEGDTPAPQLLKIARDELGAVRASWLDPSAAKGISFEKVGNGFLIRVQPNGMRVGPHTAILKLELNGPGAVVPVSVNIQQGVVFKSQRESIQWRGSLGPGATLTIQASNCTTGGLVEGELPPTRIKVDMGELRRNDLTVQQTPSRGNEFKLTLRNTGKKTATDFTLHYQGER